MLTRNESALSIAEDLLDRTGTSLVTGDFSIFGECFLLPQKIDTFDGPRLIETQEELRATFNDVRVYYRDAGVTYIVRRCVEATFQGPTVIHSKHETRLVCGDEYRRQPFDVYSVIVRVEDRWRIEGSRYAIEDAPDHVAALTGRRPSDEEWFGPIGG